MARSRSRSRSRDRRRRDSRSRSRDRGRDRDRGRSRSRDRKKRKKKRRRHSSSSSSDNDPDRDKPISAMTTFVPKASRELYFGNLPIGLTDQSLLDFLNKAMEQGMLATEPGNPAMSGRVRSNFAFVEFRNVDECTNALNLNAILINGTPINCRRPESFRPTGPPVQSTNWAHHIHILRERKPELKTVPIIGLADPLPVEPTVNPFTALVASDPQPVVEPPPAPVVDDALSALKPAPDALTPVRLQGLPYASTPEMIADFFHGCKIAANGVYIDHEPDGKPSGYALVMMLNLAEAQRAIKKHKEMMGARYVNVYLSSQQEWDNKSKGQLTGPAALAAGINNLGGLQ